MSIVSCCIDAREDVHGEGLGERGGILYIFSSLAHMSGLVNGGNLTEDGRQWRAGQESLVSWHPGAFKLFSGI